MLDTETVGTEVTEPVENQVAPETTTETTTTDTTKDDFIPKSRFTQVYAKSKANEREAAELRERVRVLEANGRQPAPESVQDNGPNPNDPKYAGNEAQYYADVAAHSGRQAYRVEKEKETQMLQQQSQATRQQAASTNYLQKVAQEVAKDASLEEGLAELNTIQFGGATTLLMEESEHAGLLAKHLAKNIGEAYRLRELSITDPLKAAVEIGKLEMKLQGTSQPVKVTKSKAPDPITPVRGGGGSQGEYKPGDGPDAFIRAFVRTPD